MRYHNVEHENRVVNFSGKLKGGYKTVASQQVFQPSGKVKEIIFMVEEEVGGGYFAQALGESIFTQADDLETLRLMVKDAVECHFLEEGERPQLIRLHIVRDEVFAL
jgi:hypothetical protein